MLFRSGDSTGRWTFTQRQIFDKRHLWQTEMSARVINFSRGVCKTQTGMALLLCLMFLMALTLIGLSASSDTILQNKLAGNLQETERAKQSALLTLSWAEQWLLALDGAPPEICTAPCDGLFLHAAGDLSPHPESESFSWWMDQGHDTRLYWLSCYF